VIGRSTEPDGIRREPVRHVTATELALRWRVSTRTLDRWRVEGKAPPWMQINGRILYRLSDVLAFEALRLRRPKD